MYHYSSELKKNECNKSVNMEKVLLRIIFKIPDRILKTLCIRCFPSGYTKLSNFSTFNLYNKYCSILEHLLLFGQQIVSRNILNAKAYNFRLQFINLLYLIL